MDTLSITLTPAGFGRRWFATLPTGEIVEAMTTPLGGTARVLLNRSSNPDKEKRPPGLKTFSRKTILSFVYNYLPSHPFVTGPAEAFAGWNRADEQVRRRVPRSLRWHDLGGEKSTLDPTSIGG